MFSREYSIIGITNGLYRMKKQNQFESIQQFSRKNRCTNMTNYFIVFYYLFEIYFNNFKNLFEVLNLF